MQVFVFNFSNIAIIAIKDIVMMNINIVPQAMESAFDVCTEDLFNQVFGKKKKLFEQKIDIYVQVHFIFLPTNHDARLSSLQTF